MIFSSTFGAIEVDGAFGEFKIDGEIDSSGVGVEELTLTLTAKHPAVPPRFEVRFSAPDLDAVARWTPLAGMAKNLPPAWNSAIETDIAHGAPAVAFLSAADVNVFTFAVSEAKRRLQIDSGINEKNGMINSVVTFFDGPECAIEHYEVKLRFDRRRIFYAETIADIARWFAAMPEYFPTPVPEAALKPLYSSWYSYHQEVFSTPIEAECAAAYNYGMRGVILDDGWQTDDDSGGYAFCGDWQVSKRRFADMARHVARVHAAGLKYLVWFSVPFIGESSANFERFKGKYLYSIPRLKTAVLDPRFPEVREFLLATWLDTVKAWDLDGLKLDFIDRFEFNGVDPAATDGGAGRDIASLPEAVDTLLSRAIAEFRAVKPDFMVEFRQRYIGPAIRKYGNLFRAADCPSDPLSNRVRTLDLRLFSGDTAVHSDMLMWQPRETVEKAAAELQAVLFSVPQISVRLAELPAEHSDMLRFWLEFISGHAATLLHGKLSPRRPDLNYPEVRARSDSEEIIAVYDEARIIELDTVARTVWIVNASNAGQLNVNCGGKPDDAEVFDVRGHALDAPRLHAGFNRCAVPAAGLLKLEVN